MNESERRMEMLHSQISRDFYNPNYFDRFDIGEERQMVTVVIRTYNRSPYPLNHGKYKLNPLVWSTHTIFDQRPKVSQIIIVDDGSQDHTESIVKNLQREEKDIDIVYLRNSQRQGGSRSLNGGIKHSEYPLIYTADDDCAVTPYSIWAARYVIGLLRKDNPNVALIKLPVYIRSAIPTKVLSKEDIGNVDFEEGVVTSNFDAFPSEYLDNPEFIDEERKILLPFRIINLDGIVLLERDVIGEIGYYPENLYRGGNSFGEHTEVGCRLFESGYESYFLPDPKFHAFHGKYGAPGRAKLEGFDWTSDNLINGIALQQIIGECEIVRGDTGSRVGEKEWYYSKIRNFLEILGKRDKTAARRWAERAHSDFVVNNLDSFGTSVVKKIPERGEREEIWEKAVHDGFEALGNM